MCNIDINILITSRFPIIIIIIIIMVRKPEGKRPLGRPRRRWEDNIMMDLQEVGRGCWD